MSILIKSMKMPTSCDVCRFAIDGFCYASGKVNVLAVEDRQVTNYCPLVHVQPHGRLIDADALLKDITPTDEDEDNGAKLLMNVFCQVVKTRPTIIPAEEPFGKSEQLNA